MGGLVDNTLGTNIFGENSNAKGAQAQGRQTEAANAQLAQSYAQQQGYLDPYAKTGGAALNQLASGQLMDGNQVLANDPGYAFRLAEGNKAINAGAAARGMGNSGAALKALTAYGQNFASNEYNNAYNRQYQNLSTLAGMGQNAATNLSGAAGSYGANVSNNLTGLGNAQAAAAIAQGNQGTTFVNGLMNNAKSGIGMVACDERIKTDIREISTTELDELRACITPYAFKYKDEKHGKGEWIGPMAQDLQKSKLGKTIVVEGEDGVLRIDMDKAVCMMFAILGAA